MPLPEYNGVKLYGMNSQTEHPGQPSGFLRKSTMGVAITALLFLTPFAINNFFQGRYVLGGGSLAIVILLAVNAWSTGRGRYHSSFTLLSIIPAILFFLTIAFLKQGIIGALWCYPAVIACYFMLPEKMARLANAAILCVALPMAWNVLDFPLAARVAATLIAVSAFSAIFVRVITDQQRLLQAQAVTDSLTGLYNRVLLGPSLDQAIEQQRRTNAVMTLVTLDLDHFKTINDTLGHDAGDTVLQGIGELLRNRIRRSDKAFRLGGEEFLVLLYGTDLENGRRFAEELRSAVESLPLLSRHTVTASLGVATLQPGEDWDAWMKRSDENLYRAKADGRNRVVS